MKKGIILLFSIFMSVCFASAQPQRGKFNPQEFKAKLENFVTKEAGFTQPEAQAFFPIYFEMKGKQRGLQRQIFQLKKNTPANAASDKDYAIKIQKIKDLGVEIAQLEVTYYKKMCQSVSPQKVYKAMLAEDKFHREMLENFGTGGNRNSENRPRQR